MIDGEGNRRTKQDELDYIANNQWDPGSFEFRIERLQIYQGAFAVIAGTGVAEKYTYKSSNFLVKENGVWRAIASHVSGRRAVGTIWHEKGGVPFRPGPFFGVFPQKSGPGPVWPL